MLSGPGSRSTKPLTLQSTQLALILLAFLLALAACGAETPAASAPIPAPAETLEPQVDASIAQTEEAATPTDQATATADQAQSESADAVDQPEGAETVIPTEAEVEVDDAVDEAGYQDPSGAGEPSTVHVSADGQGDFATLNEAVQAVLPGAIILLDAGDHQLSERLVFTKSLTIQGEGVDLTTVSCSVGGSPIISFGDGDLVMKNLAVERAGEYAGDILTVNGGSVSLENCVISGGAGSQDDAIRGHGIILRSDTVASIENCSITDNMGVGIGILETVTATINQTTISNNKGGVIFAEEASGEIADSVFANNRDQAVLVIGNARVSVISNTVHDNEDGIVFRLEASGGEARDNDLARNGADMGGVDILVMEDYYPAIAGNKCDGGGVSFSDADFNGIVFITRSSSPSDAPVLRNSCSVARCSTPTGSFLSMECR